MTDPGCLNTGSSDGPGAPDSTTDPAPSHCYRHPDRSTYVSCIRCERPICAECMRPASVGFMCPDDANVTSNAGRPLRTRFGGIQRGDKPYVTLTLLAMNVVAFFLQGFPISSNARINQFTVDYSSFNGYIAINHEYYRLLTGA